MALLEPQKYISEMGWGVIFPAVPRDDPAQQGIDAIREALQPLLDHRRAEATLRDQALYREFLHGNGCRPGDTAHKFLARHGVGPGKVEPSLMPYYLLLVGGPEAIPFEFQYQLDVQYAVGRIEFDTPEEYRRYAESVVQAETGTSVRPQKVALFAPRHEQDLAMDFLHSGLIRPLAARLEATKPDWPLTLALAEYATKARLGQFLGGDETPALAFLAGHGLGFQANNPRQLAHQGALVCQDWPGPGRKGTLTEDFYFSADDLSPAANLFGLIAFAFADYGAGTPRFDDFYRQGMQTNPVAIAERAFLARLPQRLLSHPQGGALAFVSHVERNWVYSFTWDDSFNTGVRTYAAVIERLLEGYPVGAALEVFNQRYAELATVLAATLDRLDQKETIDPFDLAGLWTATIDARNWVVIGDPAVRLMVSGLRPDMAGLKLLYQVENLRREGDRLAEAGDLAGAEDKYQRVVELNPWLGVDPAVEARSVSARMGLRSAKQMAEKGQLEEAAARLEQAQQLNPDLGLATIKEVGLLLAPYLLKEGREAARAGSYERALELLSKAARYDPILGVDASAEARRGVVQYHVEEGRRLAQAGNAAEAIDQYEQACAFDPALKSTFDPTQDLQPKLEAGKYAARFFQEQGDKLAEQGDRAQAAAAFRQAVELDPTLAKEWEPEARADRLVAQYQKERARAAKRRSQLERLPSAATDESAQWLWFNGVNAATGEYATPPLTAEELVRLVRGETSWNSLKQQAGQRRLATSSGDSSLGHL
jgi:tetratricopeptide (TPR) repeat protein